MSNEVQDFLNKVSKLSPREREEAIEYLGELLESTQDKKRQIIILETIYLTVQVHLYEAGKKARLRNWERKIKWMKKQPQFKHLFNDGKKS